MFLCEWFFVIVFIYHTVYGDVIAACSRYYRVDMLVVSFVFVLGNTVSVWDIQVGQNRADKNCIAITIHSSYSIHPSTSWSSKLFSTFFILLILDVVIDKIPNVFTGFIKCVGF